MRRIALSALALALTLGVAAQASAANINLGDSTWTALGKGPNGEVRVDRIHFDNLGGFRLTTTEYGKTVLDTNGTYEIQGGTLVLKTNGNEFRIKVISQDSKLLVLHHEQTGEMRYARVD